MQEAAKEHVRAVAERAVDRTLDVLRRYGVLRFGDREVKLAVMQLCNDEVVQLELGNNVLREQHTRVRPMSAIVCRAIDHNVARTDGGSTIDAKVFRQVCRYLQAKGASATPAGRIAVATFVSEVCGILLQTAARGSADRTLTKAALEHEAFVYEGRSGKSYNSALCRLVCTLTAEDPPELAARAVTFHDPPVVTETCPVGPAQPPRRSASSADEQADRAQT